MLRSSKLWRVLLLAGLCTAVISRTRAQDFTGQQFSLSPNLSGSLTDDPATQPVTTLSIDLLAPQRPFIYDATGASLLANTLNPEITSSDLSLAVAPTDTAIRDSSQSGELNPFTLGSSRQSLLLSGARGTSAPASSGDDTLLSTYTSGAGFTGSSISANRDFSRTSMNASDSSDSSDQQSSWGGSSSFASISAEPQARSGAWGNAKISIGRMDQTTQTGEEAASGSGAGTATTESNFRSGQLPLSTLAGMSNRASTTTPVSSATTGMRQTGASAEPNADHPTRTPRYPASPSSSLVARSSSADSQQSAASTSSPALPLFSSPANSGHSFGVSPFSSPAGAGELTFLNPDIFDISTVQLSGSTQRGQRTHQPQKHGLTDAANGELATGSTYDDGLSTHLGITESRLPASQRRKTAKNPFLTDNDPGRQ